MRLSTNGDCQRGGASAVPPGPTAGTWIWSPSSPRLSLVDVLFVPHRRHPLPSPHARFACVLGTCPWTPVTVGHWGHWKRGSATGGVCRLSASGTVGGVSGDYRIFSTTGCRRSSGPRRFKGRGRVLSSPFFLSLSSPFVGCGNCVILLGGWDVCWSVYECVCVCVCVIV